MVLIELFASLPPQDVDFLDLMINRRHLFVHNGGRVDQKYLDVTRDQTVKLNQALSVRTAEIARVVPMLRQCATNLVDGFEAIA